MGLGRAWELAGRVFPEPWVTLWGGVTPAKAGNMRASEALQALEAAEAELELELELELESARVPGRLVRQAARSVPAAAVASTC